MMQMRIAVISCVFLLGLICLSCNVEEIDEVVVLADVKDEFYLDLWEVLGPENRKLEFQISTIEEENCRNAYIDHHLEKSNGAFAISLRDIRQPDPCAPGRAPARTTVNLGNLNLGFYNFTVDLKNTVFNQGQLTALSDRYLIKMETENGVKLTRKELFRVPDGIVWGYAHYRSSDDENRAREFVNDVRKLGESLSIRQGYYGHFTIGSGGSLENVYGQPEDSRLKYVIASYKGDEADLQQLVDQYRTAYGGQVDFLLYNSRGKAF